MSPTPLPEPVRRCGPDDRLSGARRRARRPATATLVACALATVSPHAASAQQAETVRDADSSRVILAVVLGLVALGILLAVVTVWFWRSTRPDHPVLLRLETLGSRRVRRLPVAERQAALDRVPPHRQRRAATVLTDATVSRGPSTVAASTVAASTVAASTVAASTDMPDVESDDAPGGTPDDGAESSSPTDQPVP